MDKKYQIFISSTYEDLKDQRDQAVKSILLMGHLPVGMEMFNAADDTQWEIIKGHIDNSDYYVVILAYRYGSEDATGVSYTEKEYDYALEKGVPCLGFVIDSNADWSPKLMAQGEQANKLLAFKEKIKSRMVNFWTNSDNLSLKITASLAQAFNTKPRTGWVRANEVMTSPLVAEELSRLSKRNEELTAQLALQKSDEHDIAETTALLDKEEFTFQEVGEKKSLLDIFLATCRVQDNPESYMVYENLFDEQGDWSTADETTEQALGELHLLNLVNRHANATGPRFFLTDKGKQLYTKYRYS